ncbi:MAG: CopG family transcriptional regulator [Campylobacteraceae bacterium]|nr:CopG family transcriptional regulator [Campylobacteraceae bacterium]
MKAEELDKLFDNGDDLLPHLDLSTAKRIGTQPKKINVDFPEWIINALDMEAKKIGVTRQSIIKVWISERLKIERAS